MADRKEKTRIMHEAVVQGFRLSPQQEHVWGLLDSGNQPGLVSQCALEIAGELDVDRLLRALERVSAKHEILRTTFQAIPGMTLPIQVVHEESRVCLEELSGAAREEALEVLLAEARATPFDLAEGPLLRTLLFSSGPGRHTLILSLPALVADASSVRHLAREIAAACTGDGDRPGEEEPLQYADAAEILHEWLEASELGRVYWRRQDFSALLRLQGGPHPADASYDPLRVRSEIDRESTERIERLAARLGTTVSILLQAVWHTALWRSTGEGEIVVGTLFDGRTCAELQHALGLFARVLPLCCQIETGSSLGDLVSILEQKTSEAAEWQDTFSAESVRSFLAPDGRAPRWPFGFDFERLPEGGLPGGGSAFTWREEYACVDRFDLRLSVREAAGRIRLDLFYEPRICRRAEAERLLARFRRLLEGVLSEPETALGEIDALSRAERRELLVDFNDTARTFGEELLVSELFAEQARLTPDATALVCGDLRLTFAELEARSNRLAHTLSDLGVGADSLVGVCLERSPERPEVVEGLLGVLKAGGAYVPLDPSYPADRLAFMIADSGISVLLTEECLLHRLPAPDGSPRTVLCLDAGREEMRRRSDEALPRRAAPGHLAYVIYTSGSTGRPKGVMISHGALANYLLWAREAYRASEGRGAPVHSPLGFDLTVTSLFVPLIAGGTVVLLPEGQRVGALATALREPRDFSLVKITPAHLEVLRHLLSPEECAGRTRALVIGGDALWAENLAFWREHAPATRLINEYGPTETTVGCSVYEVKPEDGAAGPVPIGRPIANTRLYLLNPGFQPVPSGVAGELWIGGSGLARGYLGRPDLTAERFVPDPFSPEDGGVPGARLYRTGDLVRRRPDGDLEFLGRIDDQVKIRGFRIEPAEIEVALTAHPQVAEAVVAARDAEEGKRLVAYFVPWEGCAPSAADLHAFASERLPEPMVPAVFVALPALPLTPNGKIDRRALPEPDAAESAATAYTPPRTLVEDLLAGIWAHVLGVDRVGIDHPFFSLGGDSIRSLQVVSLASERGLKLTLEDLFQQPTIRSLARRARWKEEGEGEATSEPFSLVSASERERLPRSVVDAYPLARLQAGMLFHSEYSAGSAIYHDLHSFRLRGRYDGELLKAALQRVVHRHPVLRTSFDLSGEPLQLVHEQVPAPVTIEDLRHLGEEERGRAVALWLDRERHRGFDYSRPPLLRFHLHRLGEDSFQFTLSFHHAVLDGWSAASLLTELFRLYTSLLEGSASVEEAPVPVSFRDFVRLERSALASPQTRELWQRHLADAEPGRLPRWPVPPTASPRAHDLSHAVPAGVAEGLWALARSLSVPLKSVLLAAHLRVVSFVSGQEDVVTGFVSNGRPEHVDSDQVLGLFLNTLPLRVRLGGETWSELAQAAFDLEREILPHRRYPLADLQSERGGQPLFETVFNFLHYHVYEVLRDVSSVEVLERYGYEETNFPLGTTFQLELGGLGIYLQLNYSDSQISREQVEAIRDIYLRALEAMAADPGRPHREASLLSPEEERQLLAWGDGGPAAGGERPVHESFEERAGETPEAVALFAGEHRLTYGELNRQANRLAHSLQSLGVGASELVGLFLARTPRLVSSILGVWKAGGAYLPLDPSHPAERLAWVLEDSGARALVTERSLLPTLSSWAGGLSVLCLEDLEASGPEENLQPVCGPGSLAYILYTSGSTGRPKGVLVEHGNLADVLAASRREHGWSSGDVMPLLAPFTFDISLFELMSPLLAGGSAVLFELQPALDLGRLVDSVESFTQLHAVPALMRQIVAAVKARDVLPGTFSGLRTLFVGGDAVPADLLAELREVFPAAEIRILYGPTEGTIICTSHRVPSEEREPRPLLGQPLAGVELRLCDSRGDRVPVGTPGEIWLGGAGVTRGYLGQPQKTLESYPIVGGRRFYRTGDLARYLPDGALEFLGRVDDQVKIRGFRIELGEVEAALTAHPAVAEAVVAARAEAAAPGSRPGDKRLVAYILPRGEEPSADELRAFLRSRLPDYMVPSAFVSLSALPLSPNGKVDRKALPAPRPAETGEEAALPRTRAEEVLARLWAEALRLERVGIHDDFFSLGGDSILSLQITTRAQREGIVITPRLLFEHPTVAGLAAHANTVPTAVAEQGPVTGPVPLTPIQRLLFAQELRNPHHYNHSMLLETPKPLHPGSLADALAQIAAHHDALRLRFARDASGIWHQSMAPEELHSLLTRIDLSALPEDGRTTALSEAVAQMNASLNLAEGPLTRAGLFDLGPGRSGRLLWVIHHLAVDGFSWRVLFEDLQHAYLARERGEPSHLPAKTTSFKAWAELLSERARSPETLEELPYWLAQGPPEPPGLPLDEASGSNTEASTELVSLSLSPEETKAILQSLPALYRTRINDVLLTALAYAFWRWTNERSLSVNMEQLGREPMFDGVDLGRTVGWFTALFPLLLRLEDPFDLERSLLSIQRQLGAVPHQGIGYGLLRHLGTEETAAALGAMAVPQVSFNYLGQIDLSLLEPSFLSLAPEPSGSPHDPQSQRLHQLDVSGQVLDGCLRMSIAFSRNLHRRSKMEALAAWLREGLQRLAAAGRKADPALPSPSDFPLARLHPKQLERLLELAGRGAGAAAGRSAIEDAYLCSPMQRGMLFHSLYAPSSGVFVHHRLCTFSSAIDETAFRHAWERVIERQPILRTWIAWEGMDEPIQVVQRQVALDLETPDWRGLPEAEQQRRIEATIREGHQRGFDISCPPLMRFLLARTADETYRFLWLHHHLLLDGWSHPLLVHEALTCYEALLRGEEPRLSPVIPFRNYIAWLEGQDLGQAEVFWRQALAGFTRPTPLPGDRGAADPESGYGAEVNALLSSELTQALNTLARQRSLTVNTLIQGAWAILLSRTSAEPDVVFGAVVSGRPPSLPGVDSIIGLFINTIPVRASVSPRTPLIPWLRELQSAQAEARRFDYVSLAQVQTWSEIPRGQSLFESLVVFENYPIGTAGSQVAASLGLTDASSGGMGNYPLSLAVFPGASIRLKLEFDTPRIEPLTAERILSHLEQILERMTRCPDGCLGDLMSIAGEEKRQMVDAFNEDLDD